jgi:hypothetical protein
MRNIKALTLIVIFSIAVIAGCASAKRDNRTAGIIQPDMVIRQIGGVAIAARNQVGPISVNLEVDVINRSAEPIKLQQITLETVGLGAYNLVSTSRPFDTTIEPGHVETVKLLLTGQSQGTIQGANGPVTMRGIGYFDTEFGKFQRVFLQQVNDGMRGQPQAQ